MVECLARLVFNFISSNTNPLDLPCDTLAFVTVFYDNLKMCVFSQINWEGEGWNSEDGSRKTLFAMQCRLCLLSKCINCFWLFSYGRLWSVFVCVCVCARTCACVCVPEYWLWWGLPSILDLLKRDGGDKGWIDSLICIVPRPPSSIATGAV